MANQMIHYSSEAVSEEYLHINNCSTLKHDMQDSRIIRPIGRKDYLLIYIQSGCCYLNIDSKNPITAPKGSVLFYRPGEPQDYTFYAKDNVTQIYIHFTGVGCEKLIEKACIGDNQVIIPKNISELEHYVVRICEEFDNTDNQKSLLCEGLLMTVLGLIATKNKQDNGTSLKFSRELNEIIGSIRTRASQPYNLDNWAKQCNISKTHFIHTFKQATGLPPYQYLTSIRMKHAKELLLFTDMSISKIGELCGYSDYNYFARVFKKYVGVTPSAYRNSTQ